MNFKQLARGECGVGLAGGLLTLFLAVQGHAQGTLEYHFFGQVSSMNPGSAVFPGVSLGTTVEGWFTLNYDALDSDPSPTAGTYSSAQVGFRGTIGGSAFGSAANPGNQVRVVNETQDWTILQVAPAGGLADLSLTFFDSSGQALNGQALPDSPAAFHRFPTLTLFARDNNGAFGQYTVISPVITVPEPATPLLAGLSLLVLLAFRCGRRSANV